MTLLSHLINGLSLGSVYAIIALGYTMVYGIAKMLNFAHGDVIMVGGYISFFAMASGFHPLVAILLAMLVCTILGVTIEKLAYKPLRQAPSLAVLITAIGVSTVLQQLALLLWGSAPKVYTSVVPNRNFPILDGGVNVSLIAIVTISACIAIMTLLTWFINRTKVGKGMRAVSEDKGAAQLMGISVDGTISITFLIGAALAGVAGCLFCSMYTLIMPTTGAMPGIKAFTAAVFGGIGSIPGAMLGGILLGIIEILGKAYISTQLSDAIVFMVLIIILLIKPTGLLGKKIMEKV